MTPSFLDNMSWRMAEVYGAVTDRILINLAKYFAFVNDSAEVKGSFEYQARMLAKMGQVTKETVDIIANSLDGADAALRAALEAAIMDALKNEEPKLRQAAQLGLLGAVPPGFVPDQSQAFKSYYQQSADKLNLVNTVMLESTQAAYSATVADAAARLERTQEYLNVAAGETITGVSTYNQAMRGAVAKMMTNGLTGFIDHAGRRWTPESYVAMDVRTTMFRTARAAVWERQDQYGNDLYQVSSHNGARPLCYPWQGKVISRSDTVRDVTDLDGNTVHVYAQSETSYGQAAGLFGVNCGHYPMSFIPGVSTLKGEPQDPAENEKTYAESQEQRALERKLRAERRDLAVMKAQGESPEAIRKQQERVKAASAEIDDFCDRTGRARRKLREYTPIDAKWPVKDSYDPQTFPGAQRQQMQDFFGNDNLTTAVMPGTATPAPQNVAPQSTNGDTNAVQYQMQYGAPFDTTGDSKRLANYKEDAKNDLDNAPENAKRVWSKVSDRMRKPEFGGGGDSAYYAPGANVTHYSTQKKAFEESSYQRKNAVFFHEYGHNIDNLLASDRRKYYSHEYKDNLLGKTILKECDARVREFYFQKNGYSDAYEAVKGHYNQPGEIGFAHYIKMALRGSMPGSEYREMVRSVGDDDASLRPLVEKHLSGFIENEINSIVHSQKVGKEFMNWVKNNYSIYQRTDISDMFQKYTVDHYATSRPFGIGHAYSYFNRDESLPTEAFAEMYSATITNNDSLPVIKEFFPEAYKVFEEMLGDAVK